MHFTESNVQSVSELDAKNIADSDELAVIESERQDGRRLQMLIPVNEFICKYSVDKVQKIILGIKLFITL